MGILKKSKNIKLSQKFVDFILTEDFQGEIPLTNWMFPVNPEVKLPDSFRYAPTPDKILYLNTFEIQENQKRWIESWLKIVIK